MHTLAGEEAALHYLQHNFKLEKAFGATAWTHGAHCRQQKQSTVVPLPSALPSGLGPADQR